MLLNFFQYENRILIRKEPTDSYSLLYRWHPSFHSQHTTKFLSQAFPAGTSLFSATI